MAEMNKPAVVLFAIAILAVVAYLPTLSQPLIEDDYPNILLAREYGPPSGWSALFSDGVQRVRATSFILFSAAERTFGLNPTALYAISIFLHILNCFLVYAMGRWELVGYRVSAWAAAFFAVYEGHQEAVMWYSAVNELLLFVFGISAFICLLIFLERGPRRYLWLAASIFLFVFALLSKESAVIFVPLMAIPILFDAKNRSQIFALVPHALLSTIVVTLILATRGDSFRFTDRSFELSAPFWLTLTYSFAAMLWFWGILALAVNAKWRERWRLVFASLAWMSVSFVPYMFVAYMHRIPSRQTYLASLGLAFIVGSAFVLLIQNTKLSRKLRPIIVGVIVIMFAANIAYLWTKKRQQFLARAEPTEQLLNFVVERKGPIFVECFPRPPIIGDTAVELKLGRKLGTLIWDKDKAFEISAADTFCYREK